MRTEREELGETLSIDFNGTVVVNVKMMAKMLYETLSLFNASTFEGNSWHAQNNAGILVYAK